MKNILEKIFYLYDDNKEIYPFYTLRFFFFLFIFIHHCYNYVQIPILRQPTLAVSGFIILSGFLNGYIYIKKDFKLKEIFSFTFKRIKKLYPLHILLFILIIPISGLFNITTGIELFYFIKRMICNLFLIQSWINNSNYYFSFNGVTWFLSVYMFLTFVTLPIMFLFKKIFEKKHKYLWLITLVFILFFATLLIVYIIKKNELPDKFCEFWIYIFPPSRLFEYIIGMILGIICYSKKISFKFDKFVFSILEIFSLLILYNIVKYGYKILNISNVLNLRFNYWILPLSLILIVFSYRKGIISRLFSLKIFVFFGKISMYMFIIHQPLISYFSRSSGHVVHFKYLGLYMLFITIILSCLIYKYETYKNIDNYHK